jgi:hypothetical protein
MARGNLSYAQLATCGSGAEFLQSRDLDVAGTDPVAALFRRFVDRPSSDGLVGDSP